MQWFERREIRMEWKTLFSLHTFLMDFYLNRRIFHQDASCYHTLRNQKRLSGDKAGRKRTFAWKEFQEPRFLSRPKQRSLLLPKDLLQSIPIIRERSSPSKRRDKVEIKRWLVACNLSESASSSKLQKIDIIGSTDDIKVMKQQKDLRKRKAGGQRSEAEKEVERK